MKKNRIKKYVCAGITLFVVCLIHVPVYGKEASTIQKQASSDEIVILGEKIGWRYKMIDGKLHKRLYNYTKGIWIGEWIPV